MTMLPDEPGQGVALSESPLSEFRAGEAFTGAGFGGQPILENMQFSRDEFDRPACFITDSNYQPRFC